MQLYGNESGLSSRLRAGAVDPGGLETPRTLEKSLCGFVVGERDWVDAGLLVDDKSGNVELEFEFRKPRRGRRSRSLLGWIEDEDLRSGSRRFIRTLP